MTTATVIRKSKPAAAFEFEALEGLPCGCVAAARRGEALGRRVGVAGGRRGRTACFRDIAWGRCSTSAIRCSGEDEEDDE